MRTAQNENQVNNLLGKIDLLPEEKLQNEGFYRFYGKDSIYMMSPILVEREKVFRRFRF
jgi:hypothetical protein